MKIVKFVLPVIAAGFAASSAMAATVDVSVDANNTVAGVTANSIVADGQGDDWTGIVMLVDLTAGSVYNGIPDSNAPQAAFWAVPGFEALEFDTWFGVPFDATNGVAGGAGDLGDLGGLAVAGNKISITAFDTTVTDTAATRVANVSLSDDAAGTWQMIVSFAGGQIQTGGDVVAGELVPEPATLALMGLGGIAALRRRR